jgi:hypothetical protein
VNTVAGLIMAQPEITARKIRNYCIETFVKPARANGKSQVTIRIGDVSRGLEFSGMYGFINVSIRSNLFQSEARVRGPKIKVLNNGPNAEFTFEILP